MQTYIRKLFVLAILPVSFTLSIGCGDGGSDGPKPANSDLKLKPLPPPGSPGDGGKAPKNQPGGTPKAD
jgi:hypothetical protein